MDPKDKEIERLKALVRKLTVENEYLKSPLYLFELTEQIQGRYSILLNPPLKDFRTTNKQKATFFKIDVNEIICVVSDGKSKQIYFSKPQTSIEGAKWTSDKLSFTGTLEDVCTKFDNTKIHLCIVSKSVAVNLFYYYLDKDRLKLTGIINPHNSCDNVSVSPKFLKNYIERKSALEHIISFQKNQFHSK